MPKYNAPLPPMDVVCKVYEFVQNLLLRPLGSAQELSFAPAITTTILSQILMAQ
ncbi:hypothetical protein RUND412_011567, partial [Rhizina undulata]